MKKLYEHPLFEVIKIDLLDEQLLGSYEDAFHEADDDFSETDDFFNGDF